MRLPRCGGWVQPYGPRPYQRNRRTLRARERISTKVHAHTCFNTHNTMPANANTTTQGRTRAADRLLLRLTRRGLLRLGCKSQLGRKHLLKWAKTSAKNSRPILKEEFATARHIASPQHQPMRAACASDGQRVLVSRCISVLCVMCVKICVSSAPADAQVSVPCRGHYQHYVPSVTVTGLVAAIPQTVSCLHQMPDGTVVWCNLNWLGIAGMAHVCWRGIGGARPPAQGLRFVFYLPLGSK